MLNYPRSVGQEYKNFMHVIVIYLIERMTQNDYFLKCISYAPSAQTVLVSYKVKP